MKPVWFLDVDGCLSPYGDEHGADAYLYEHRKPSTWSVPYRRPVVDRIARMHASGLVEVRWLTTWAPEEVTVWTERAGLGPFPVAEPGEGPYSWWKANTVVAWLAGDPGRRAVWTDDDIDTNPHRGRRIRATFGDRLLAIAPDRTIGLTDENLDQVEEWLSGGHRSHR